MVSRTRSAVPTGTVDLSMITLNSVMRAPMLRAAASTYWVSAEPSSSGGVPTAMNCSVPWRDRGVDVGGEAQPAGRDVAPDHFRQPGLVDRHAAAVEQVDLGGVDIEAEHVVADLGQAGAADQAHITGTDDGDVHAPTLSEALIRASSAAGSAAWVIGRPITR